MDVGALAGMDISIVIVVLSPSVLMSPTTYSPPKRMAHGTQITVGALHLFGPQISQRWLIGHLLEVDDRDARFAHGVTNRNRRSLPSRR